MNNSVPKVLTATKAAIFLNMSVSSVKILSDKNIIPSWKTSGGHRRYDQNELANYKFEMRRNLKKLNAKIIILTNLQISTDSTNLFDPSGLLEIKFVESLPDIYFSFAEGVPDVVVFGMDGSIRDQIEQISLLKQLIERSTIKVNLICFSEHKNIDYLLSEQIDNYVILKKGKLTEDWINTFALGFVSKLQLEVK
jgi:hypothetical protein